MDELDLVLVFPTTHLTLSAEKTLERVGIRYRTIMKPRKISSDCGLAIRVGSDSADDCRKSLAADGILPVRFFREAAGQWNCLEELDPH